MTRSERNDIREHARAQQALLRKLMDLADQFGHTTMRIHVGAVLLEAQEIESICGEDTQVMRLPEAS